MDLPDELAERSPDETHEALRLALLDALAQLDALNERVAALETPAQP